jgi:SAM-dependent methyltransferase
MSETRYSGTIDWDEYWDTADEKDTEDASPSTEYIIDPLGELFEERGVPETYADVGCGPGAAVFDVAERYPETTVVGYDAADAVLAENRKRARADGVDNVSFEHARLPEFDPDQQFDVVTCFYTLCYVADIEAALANLYDAVAPGGYLVITYHNQHAQRMFQAMADAPEEFLDEDGAWKPGRFSDRFELVIEGESLLSYRQIHDVLGSWPQSVWSAVEDAERYRAWKMNPLVFVPT